MANQEQNLPQQEQPFVTAKRKPFIKSPNMYQEYVAKFWYSSKALENSKVSFLISIGDAVRKWFLMIRYGEEVSTKRTLRKSLIPPRWSKEATKGGSTKASTGSKTGHFKRRKESSSAMDSNPSRPLVSTLVDTKMHKEDQQATGGPTFLGVTSEERANPQLNSDQTKAVSEGLETILTQPATRKGASSTAIHGDKEEASTSIHGEKKRPPAKSSWRILQSYSLPTRLKDLPFKFNELTEEIKGLKTQVYKLEIKLPKELKEIPIKLEDFTKTATKEDEKESTESDYDDEAHVAGSMVESSKTNKLKKFDFVTEEGEHIHLTEEQINHQKKLEEEAKAEAAKQEREARKAKLIDLLGYEIVHKYYKEDDTSEVIPNFKASDLHLDELREVVKACPNRKGKGWKTIYGHIGIRMDYLHSTEAKLGINLDIPLTNKRLKSSVQYEDYSPGTVLNDPVLGFIEKFGGGFEQYIDEQEKEKRSGEDEESKKCCGLKNGRD
nr:hypothetical protein [Tanacetum cinerariifolium]